MFSSTGEIIPGACGAELSEQPGELVSVLQRVKFDKSPHHCDQRFSSIFNNILRTMAYKAPSIDEKQNGVHLTLAPCWVAVSWRFAFFRHGPAHDRDASRRR